MVTQMDGNDNTFIYPLLIGRGGACGVYYSEVLNV